MNRFRDDFVAIFVRIDLWAEAAALAFYSLLSMAPLILLFFAAMSLAGVRVESEFIEQSHALLGPEAAATVETLLTNLRSEKARAAGSSLAGLAMLFFSASAVFSQLKKVMVAIFAETPASPGRSLIHAYLAEKLFSMGIVIAFIFVTACSLVLSSLLARVRLETALPPGALDLAANLALYTFIFFMVFKIVPRRHLRNRGALKGGFLTSLLFVAGKGLIGFYIGNSILGSAFGTAGAFVIFLIWMYYTAFVVFLSAALVKAGTDSNSLRVAKSIRRSGAQLDPRPLRS